MRQVFLQKGKIHVAKVSAPLLTNHHILVRVHYSFISSGTEVATLKASSHSIVKKYTNDVATHTAKIFGAIKEHGIAGTLALAKEKIYRALPLGYSCTGQVISVGAKVEKFRVGDYVACAGASLANHADVVTVPQNLVTMVQNPSFLKHASLTAIGAIALQGLRRAQLQLGEKVCIIGMGLIGQITLQLAKQAGYYVIGIDIQNDRLALAKKLGADACFNPLEHDIDREIEFATGHYGVDVTIITAASDSGAIIQQAMQVTRRKGKVVLVGDVKIDFDRTHFYAKEIDFLISCSYGPGRYDALYENYNVDYPYAYVRWTENRNMSYFVDLIEKKKIDLSRLITREFDVIHAASAYESLQKDNALGVVLSYSSNTNEIELRTHQNLQKNESTEVKPYIPQQGLRNISMIGVGGFAKIKILPTIAKMQHLSIHSIIDTDTSNALTTARVYKAKRVSNDYRKILGDDDVHVAIIATPHAFHTEQALECLAAGKAVLLEKPAAVSFEQLVKLESFFVQHPSSLFCVDFNRSCSPFMKIIKKALVSRTNPLLIMYRMNANYLPKDHWIQSQEHRGRIIGEACHIFELFCFLTDAKPISVSVAQLNMTTDDLLATDNIIANVSMSDGSCCTLIYSSLGSPAAGKEYMEIFFDGKTIIMNDFIELKGHGLSRTFGRRCKTQKKGHEELFNQFFEATRSKDTAPPIPLERIFMATKLSLIVDKLARNGGGIEYFD